MANYSKNNKNSASSCITQLWIICKTIHIGDIIISPAGKYSSSYHVGEVKSDYYFKRDYFRNGEIQPHRREIEWFQNKILKNNFSDKLKKSINRPGTVFNLNETYSEEIESLINGSIKQKITDVNKVEAVGGFDTVLTREEFNNSYNIIDVKSIEQPYEIAKRVRNYVIQIVELCKLNNKKPIFTENNLLKLWDDLEKQCNTRSDLKLFSETLYKLIKENTRYRNPNYKNKTDPFYIFMLPNEFYKVNPETTHFIFIINTLRQYYVHDETSKIGDVFAELLGTKSGPQILEDYQKLQCKVLLMFEKSMNILLSIIKKEFEQPKNP